MSRLTLVSFGDSTASRRLDNRFHLRLERKVERKFPRGWAVSVLLFALDGGTIEIVLVGECLDGGKLLLHVIDVIAATATCIFGRMADEIALLIFPSSRASICIIASA